MALKPPSNDYDEEEDLQPDPQQEPTVPPAPAQPTQPVQPTQSNAPTAPPVPKELLSARPAMTKVVPRSNYRAAAASQELAPPAPTAEELADRQQRLEYLKGLRAQAEKDNPRKSKKWLVVVIILLLLVLGGLGGAYWFLHKPTATKQPASTAPAPTTSSTAPTKTNEEAATQKDYDSTNFSLSLKYPSTWIVADTTEALTIQSTQLQLPSASGQDKPGVVLVTIRHKQASLAEFKSGNAVAVLDSKNVSYSQPAPGQRGSTFLSYLQYNSTTTKGVLDGIYITGNSGYKKAQTIAQADVVKVDPLVTVTFLGCAGTECKPTQQPFDLNGEKFVASKTYETVETLLRSLAIN